MPLSPGHIKVAVEEAKAQRTVCPQCSAKFTRTMAGAFLNELPPNPKSNVHTSGPFLVSGGQKAIELLAYECPNCGKLTVDVSEYELETKRDRVSSRVPGLLGPERTVQAFTHVRNLNVVPGHTERPCPKEVPESIANDYREATRIAGLSRKGAATLARRCLQALLRDSFPDLPQSVRKKSLNDETDWVIDNGHLDAELTGPLKGLKNVGNFGAHPPREDGLTEVFDLAPDDLEGCFALLELLFEDLYVKRARRAERIAKLGGWKPGRQQGSGDGPQRG